MPHLVVDGRAIEYRVVPGDAVKPWLVFLHEGLGSVGLWRDFPDKLARRTGCRALIYSRFGYGHSAGIDGPRGVDFMHVEARRHLPEILAHFAIERPILVGHSDGASIALIHAADFEVAAAILLAPHVIVETVSVESIARIRKTYTATDDLKARLARHHARPDDAFLGWADVWLRPAFRDWSLIDECRRVTCPLLLIQGLGDEYGTLAQLDLITAHATGPVQRVVLDACGHVPQRDQPDAVLDAASGFVARH